MTYTAPMHGGEQWYVSLHGQQHGPIPTSDVLAWIAQRRLDRTSYVFGPGMTQWAPISSVAAFAAALSSTAAPPPPPPLPPAAAMAVAHEIDYEIFGEEMQYVEITLDPQEAAVAEAGSFLYMENGVEMQTIFGDGSQQAAGQGFMAKLMSAGKRMLTGESLFMTVFGNNAPARRKVAFAAPYPGKIIAMDLRQLGGTLLCQKDSFLCAAKGISVGMAFQKKLGVGFFGGEGFFPEKL